MVQLLGQQIADRLVVVDDLDVVLALDARRETPADVAAPRDHDFLDRAFHAAQFAHHGRNVLLAREKEHFVARLDDGDAFRHDAAVAAIDRRDAAFQVRHVPLDFLQFVAHQRPAVVGPHRHQPHLAVGKVQHLQRFRMLDQAPQGIGHFLLGADDVVHPELFGQHAGRQAQKVVGADTRDARRHIEQGRGELARHQVGFVALRHRHQHVGVVGAGLLQNGRVGSVAAHGA